MSHFVFFLLLMPRSVQIIAFQTWLRKNSEINAFYLFSHLRYQAPRTIYIFHSKMSFYFQDSFLHSYKEFEMGGKSLICSYKIINNSWHILTSMYFSIAFKINITKSELLKYMTSIFKLRFWIPNGICSILSFHHHKFLTQRM